MEQGVSGPTCSLTTSLDEEVHVFGLLPPGLLRSPLAGMEPGGRGANTQVRVGAAPPEFPPCWNGTGDVSEKWLRVASEIL